MVSDSENGVSRKTRLNFEQTFTWLGDVVKNALIFLKVLAGSNSNFHRIY